ncbi:MAG: 30S ribosomal protein S18 [Candidatus Omnitrophota bacterium]|nr:30S ribosomal protein S18 [Candidatus Omnitrophota bacterium]
MAFTNKRTDSRTAKPKSRFGRKPTGRRTTFRKKTNRFLSVFGGASIVVDYKDADRLSRFLTEKGKIIPRRITALTAKQQRMLSQAIKKARHAGLLPYQID